MKRNHDFFAIPLFALGVAGCATNCQRVGSDRPVAPAAVVPGIFEPSGAYRDMGFLATFRPVPFVGTTRFFAGPAADSTLTLVSVSLSNNALSFQRSGSLFQALYRVEAVIRSGTDSRQIVSDQAVKVAAFSETQRTDESIIFQQYINLPPGDATVTLVVRDGNSGGYSRDERSVKVPRFSGAATSSVVPFYQGTGRSARGVKPDLITNPRSTIPYGADTVKFYVEAYGAADSTLTLRMMDESDREVWRVVPALAGDTLIRTGMVRISPGVLPIGKLKVEADLAGARDTVRAPVLVSFSDQWVVANFEGVLNLLRYFGSEEQIRAMRSAPDSSRSELWKKFWRDTDPNPSTPENEALQQYFSRLQQANGKFREGSDPGWLTDRGEVYVSLGEPDEVLDHSSDMQGTRRFIRWSYTNDRLVLDFVDESGFGRYRLTASSRSEFERAVARVRRRD